MTVTKLVSERQCEVSWHDGTRVQYNAFPCAALMLASE